MSLRPRRDDSARRRRRGPASQPTTHVECDSLQAYGYHFKNNKFVSIHDDQPFEFDVYSSREENQKRYEAIGKMIDASIFDLLESECHLKRVFVPVCLTFVFRNQKQKKRIGFIKSRTEGSRFVLSVDCVLFFMLDAKSSEPTSFIFVSDNLHTAKYLMVIIHGTGVVRAGQWSRKLIMNEDLTVGSQLPYIKRAQAAGYAIIVTNTNLNEVESLRTLRSRSSRPIRGNDTAEQHGCYVWNNFVRPRPTQHVCIMAHSYGGAVVLELAHCFPTDFDKQVFAIALTDSPMWIYGRDFHKNVRNILKKKTINWVADASPVNTPLEDGSCGQQRSAGHTAHEWTSHTAIDAIFHYFALERAKLENNKSSTKTASTLV